jgi:outer membrane protein TolC
MRRVVLLIAILALSHSVCAKEVLQGTAQKYSISFSQAYELMLANNNAIKASLEEIEEKRYEKNASLGHFAPKILLSSAYARLDGPVSATIPLSPLPSRTLVLQEQELWTAQFMGMWNIFTGGKVWSNYRAKRAKLDATRHKHLETLNNLTVELTRRYFALVLADEALKVRAQALEAAGRHLNNAKTLEKVGTIAKSERLHAEVAHSQALRDYNFAKRDYAILEDGLKALIKADRADLSNIEIAASSNLFIYDGALPSLNEFKKLASENNTSLMQLGAKKEIAQANYRATVANYSPTVSLFAYDIVAQSKLAHAVPKYAAGVSVNMLLFDGLKRTNDLKAANRLRKQVAYETADADLNIEALVSKQYQEVFKHLEQYEATNAALLSAQEALRICEIGFREGIYTSLSVTDAQMALLKVKMERLNALYNYSLALCGLLATSGDAGEILGYIEKSRTEKTGL